MSWAIIQDLLVAIGLGLLVGLQREWATAKIAGIRTFPMITLFGLLSGLLAGKFGGWALAGGFLAIAAMLVAGNLLQLRDSKVDPGITTEIAALVMFAVGAILAAGQVALALAVGGTVAVLLQWKQPLHQFVKRIGRADLQALIRLVIVALVILPVLPDQSYGPFGVLNPFEIWLMVVLIVGISLGAYIAQKALGSEGGLAVAGMLGGLISSTATTFSEARRARTRPAAIPAASSIILIASALVFARVIFEIAVVEPAALADMVPPLLVMMVVLAGLAWFSLRKAAGPGSMPEAPTSGLLAPVMFGVLYAVVLFGVAAAKQWLGVAGLYGVAALSGLTDMDAITLSSVRLVQAGTLSSAEGWRLILVGAMANIVFKAVMVNLLGGNRLLRSIAPSYAVVLGAGALMLLLWP